jgi:hypothetical protein
MTQEPAKCPKCSGQMESGFMMDHAHGSGELQARWLEGKPVPRFFFDGVKVGDKEPIPVTTYRCQGCGYLESFARPSA